MEHVLPHEFDTKILENSKKTLVLFYASWCPHCANFKPTFEEVNCEGFEKRASLIDEDENPLWERFDISVVPTMIAFQNGNILTRRDAKRGIGLTRHDMKSMIEELK